MSPLSEAELVALRLVADEKVAYSRGRYFLLETGSPTAPDEIHTLRARGLVVLARIQPGVRIPPSRPCVTTGKGEAILKGEAACQPATA